MLVGAVLLRAGGALILAGRADNKAAELAGSKIKQADWLREARGLTAPSRKRRLREVAHGSC